jgi:hypothetical protein
MNVQSKSVVLSKNRPSAFAAIHAVRSTVPTFGTHVGAKLERAVARVRRHDLDDHQP